MNQTQRLERLKAEAHRLSGGAMKSFGIDDLPPHIAEQFLQRVIAFETAPMVTDFAQLTAEGVELPNPETVSDEAIGTVLWQVIVALSRHHVFLDRTNHLSDRELYSVLWNHVLREEHAALPEGDTGAWHVHVPGDDELGQTSSPTTPANGNAATGRRTVRTSRFLRIEILRTIAIVCCLNRATNRVLTQLLWRQ